MDYIHQQLFSDEELKKYGVTRAQGILDTNEKVRAFAEELHKATKPEFEKFRIARLRALELAQHTFID